jgi:4-amino-4-deoxy-L-arabinose transferase-like glycosyltransferase
MKKTKIYLFILLVIALFLRTFRLDQFLGFYYDQGRDALVIWRLIHEGKFFLIGPVTGIEGIFLGPFYYYLLTPLYFLGGGSPVFVSFILNLISVLGIYLLFKITKLFFDEKTAFLTSILTTFSYTLVVFSRWLSHPPLLPTFSLVVIYALLQIYKGKSRWWILVGIFVGLCLQLEAASAVFFLPTIIIILIWRWQKKSLPSILTALGLFLATLLPQIIFNWRHQNILVTSFKNFLLVEKSFSIPLGNLIGERLNIYYRVFFDHLFYGQEKLKLIWLGVFLILGFLKRKEIFAGERKILIFWLLIPLTLYLFYQGNHGYFLDYYLAGIWLVFMIFAGFLLMSFWHKFFGKVLLILFLITFAYSNFTQLVIYYKIGIGIILRTQLSAIDWAYQNSKGEEFNVDVYVPPVIPYAYEYLFKWYGEKKYNQQPASNNVLLLYTLYEEDSSHPNFLKNWLNRQETVGKILDQERFGDVTIQRRERKL